MNNNEYKNDNYVDNNFNDNFQNDNLNYNTNYNNQNNLDEYDENYDNNYQKYRKRKSILSAIAIGVLSFASLTGIGIGVYYLISQQNKNSNVVMSNVKNIPSDGVGQYIAERTLSLQFITDDASDSNSCMVSCGTGWIINKDKNDNSYYIATNLHVAALTTYPNQTIWNDENNNIDKYGNMVQCLIGYITQSSNYTMNMLTVEKPEVVYATYLDSNWNNLEYGSANGIAYNGTQNYQIESDFAILKYDFSENTLNNNINKETEINDFENWLNFYNSNPTLFLPNVIQDYNDLKFSMAGFPATSSENINNLKNSTHNDAITINQNNNYCNVSWEEFDDFGWHTYNNIFTNPNIGSAYNVQTYSTKNPIDPIIYYDAKNLTPNSTNPWDGGFANGAYDYLLDDSSYGGSSGSMLVTDYNGQYYVAGIYWGSVSSDDNPNNTYGSADIFNTNTNGRSNNGYNLIQFSYNYLTNNGDDLYFNPTTNQKK